MKFKAELKKDNPSSVDKKLRRQFLGCAICPPNKGENKKNHKKHGVRKVRKRWSREK